MSCVIRLHPADTVVTAKTDIEKNAYIEEEDITVKSDIPAGHKVAVADIVMGDAVIKYGEVIGIAKCPISRGEHVHTHNLIFNDSDKNYTPASDYREVEYLPESQRASFWGLVRENGCVGTRNYIGIFAASNCSATVTRRIADAFTEQVLKEYPNVDGVIPFIHGIGCGMEEGEPLALLQRTIAGYIRNPNLAGAVVVALGCERNSLERLFEAEGLQEGPMLKGLVMQQWGGTRKAVEAGIELVKKMLPTANAAARERVSVEHIILALQCGGSDAFSGLTANPALGCAADRVVENGGTVILSETTEIYGGEHLLIKKAVSQEVAQKLLDKIFWWRQRTAGKVCQMTGTVSPGNMAGGLTTVVEKSLGGIKKSGNSPLMEVYRYADAVKRKGFVFMDTAAHDPVSVTGQIAGGANVVAFTTGRGSCFGSFPAPTVKLASNTKMYNWMEEDMDVNCGLVLDEETTLQEMGNLIFEKILSVASGEKTKSEILNLGSNEFVPWDIGIEG